MVKKERSSFLTKFMMLLVYIFANILVNQEEGCYTIIIIGAIIYLIISVNMAYMYTCITQSFIPRYTYYSLYIYK